MVVVPDPPTLTVVVVVDGGGDVVVVDCPLGAVVLVELEVDEVVVDVDVVDDDVVDVVDVDVVDVVAMAGAGPGLTMLPKVVPEPAPPKMSDSGLPEISSTAVMKSNASTNTMPAAPAMAFQG